ncbi:putative glycolipid-binding domain-containing protein [Sedimentitalea nanhaiensis]|uniref:Glycolipid-binding n=1 Tax=Sedimentitalea nanhaiensis TaxID=999627 RepID=A0A1I7E9K6_9RHOB|nr:putative glycolipid-binding domain-containing protein [Sedimentitalea nanhaiensis]SFU20656.1 hypothetical protein SAMN05216236_1531 [Sedimentitalea nanhaiensis]
MTERRILWRRLDAKGHDACRALFQNDEWVLDGAAVYLENRDITNVRYRVRCDSNWICKSAYVHGWCGPTKVDVEIAREDDGLWRCNGMEITAVSGAWDVDLGFTPTTNTCAIRRLGLDVGQRKRGVAAWLDASDWKLKPLEQYYDRFAATGYEYGSSEHGFQARLETDNFGFVREYPGLWEAEE